MTTILFTLSIISGQLLKLPVGSGGLILLDVLIIVLCFLGILKTKFKLKNPPIWIKISLVFIVVSLLSLILTPISLTKEEFLISISYIIRFSFYILLGWLIYSGVFPKLKENIFRILYTSGVILAALGLIQLIFLPDLRFLSKYGWDPHYFRTASTFLDPNFLGSYLVLTLILWYQKFSKVQKWYQLSAILVYFALMTTFSRGAYLAFLISFGLLALLNRSLKQVVLTILLFLGLILGFQIYQTTLAQPRGVDRTESAKFRLNTWQQGWQLFQTHTVLGIGFNTYRYGLKQYSLADEKFLQSHGASTNDSSLLYVAATTGILGFIIYLCFLFSLVKYSWRGHLLPTAISGVLSQSFFANTLFYPQILIWIILISSISPSSKVQKK